MRNIVVRFADGVKKVIKASSQGQGIGYGSAFAQIMDSVGVKKCPGCKKREKYLDRLGKIRI